MLFEVIHQAHRSRSVLIRSLQRELPEPSPAWILNALSDQGFSRQAQVVRWTKTVIPSHGPTAPKNAQEGKRKSSDLQFRRLTEADLTSDRNQLKSLLNNVFRQTEDLKSLPSPDADELLDDWHTNQGRVFVAEVQGASVAVCVCTPELDAESISGSRAFRIQYIGVRPDYRLKGIASGMLHHVPEWLASSGEVASGHILQLSAFADLSNQPASDLYRRCGFFLEAQMGLWCRHNEQEPS
jgi:GNAT superfamily N-acetyltransferase